MLIRRAFHKTEGELADVNVVESEKENMQHLFAGSIGSFKNPGSHREVSYQSDETVELLMLASRLMKIVDERLECINLSA